MDAASLISGGNIRTFTCAICTESLEKPGPPLESFSFGKLLIDLSDLTYTNRKMMCHQYLLTDRCFTDCYYDCNKLLLTPCGHLFHSGCIREWFFIRRYDRVRKCPFCNQRTDYDECWFVHATACDPNIDNRNEVDNETVQFHNGTPEEMKHEQSSASPDELTYSDISCASSSYTPNETDVEEDPEHSISDNSAEREGNEDGNDFTTTDSVAVSQSNVKDKTRNSLIRLIRKIIGFIDKFNFIHIMTLGFTIQTSCQSYRQRQSEYLTFLDKVEDEDMATATVEENVFVPLGYWFILQLMATAPLIWAYECFVGKIFKKQ